MELRAALGQAASWTHLARGRGVMASTESTEQKCYHWQLPTGIGSPLRYNDAYLNCMKSL